MKVHFLAVYCVLVAGLLVASLYVPHDRIFLPGPQVADAGKAIIDALDQITKLIVGLNTAMLGAAAAMTVKGHEWSTRWDRLDGLLIVFVFVCSAVSYFGGYLSYVRLLSTLAVVGAPTVNPLETGMLWAIRLQYWGVIAGVCCLGAVFSRMLEGRISA